MKLLWVLYTEMYKLMQLSSYNSWLSEDSKYFNIYCGSSNLNAEQKCAIFISLYSNTCLEDEFVEAKKYHQVVNDLHKVCLTSFTRQWWN